MPPARHHTRASGGRTHGQAALVLHHFHHDAGVGLLNARQAGDRLAHHAAIFADIARAHLEQLVEITRDHVAGLDLGDAPQRIVEAAQVVLGGAGEQHLHAAAGGNASLMAMGA